MVKKAKLNPKALEKAKERASQVNMMQRSSEEMGKFDNTSATSVPMAITALLGLGIEICFYLLLLLFRISESTQILSDYFYERGWVPYLLAYLACWAFAILILKRQKLKKQENVMQFKLLPEDISVDIREDNLNQFYAHIKRLGFDPKQSFLLTRIFRGLEHFSVRKNHAETAEMLKSQSEIDATMVDSSYVLIKVFIWAIHILGFIGTVLGISEAVASFGGEMGAAADIEVIKEQLGQVTGGLSEAFDTTLVSLIFSICVMFPMSVMQKNEEDLLNQVDEYCNEYFLKRLREPEISLSSSSNGSFETNTISRIEGLQTYLLQLQESQSVVAQQMMKVSHQFSQIIQSTTIEEQGQNH